MHIRKLTYKKEDVDCKLCTEYRGKKHPCPHDVCPFIAERIEAGAVTYWDAVNAMISPQYRFARRLPKLAVEYPGTFFLDDRHRSRMEFLNTQLGYVPGRNTPAYYAAMYLLTANEIIYWRMANCFCRDGIDFRYAILRGISTYNYALYRAALALTTDHQGVTVSELDDTELIEDEVFRLIINAMLIARYGLIAMKLTKEATANGS